jgi:hypothetical protein
VAAFLQFGHAPLKSCDALVHALQADPFGNLVEDLQDV